MKQELIYRELEWRLLKHLRKPFPDVVVNVCRNKYSPGLNVEIISEAFRALLPEQRYHHVRQAFPKGAFPADLEEAVIVELAPDETLSELEDKMFEGRRLSDEEVEGLLERTDFFKELAEALECRDSIEKAPRRCKEDFSRSQGVLRGAGIAHLTELEVLEYFMERGAFCDCEILLNLS